MFKSLKKMFFGNVDVKKVNTPVINDGVMASACMTAASDMLTMSKVLMINTGVYNAEVVDYAFKLAGRLDCDIVVLDTKEISQKFDPERKLREKERFQNTMSTEYNKFSILAKSMGIETEHIVAFGDQNEIVSQVSKDDVEIRYVLSALDDSVIHQQKAQVYDLRCSRLRL